MRLLTNVTKVVAVNIILNTIYWYHCFTTMGAMTVYKILSMVLNFIWLVLVYLVDWFINFIYDVDHYD